MRKWNAAEVVVENKDKLPFLDLNLCFSGQVRHHIRAASAAAAAAAAALRTVPRSKSPDQSARFQPVRNSCERVTLKKTALIKATTFGPNAGDGHSSDTHGCTRRKLGLQQVAVPGLTATSRPPNQPSVGGCYSQSVCVVQSEPASASATQRRNMERWPACRWVKSLKTVN